MEKGINRRLCAIMFTDMAGFTKLMQRDETLGLKMRNRHKEVFEQQHKRYNGEIIQYFGDGTLSVFTNSNDAIECAVEMQRALKSPIEVPLRIGMHAGSVVIEDDGIIGDAVNIASRIESFANTGGVLISDTIHDQVKNQPRWNFVPLGKFNLKNVDRPFEIYAISTEGLQVPDSDSLRGKGEKIASLKSQIPVPVSPILGRDSEIRDLIHLLSNNQVVTITGTGGIGKTRLSIELCNRLKSEFRDGIAFVSMATLKDATEVMPTLSNALDIKEAAGRELVNGVASLISDKKALLVLDNLEHVISAASEIADLVTKCPSLKILCTSRTPLKIKAEQEYSLHALTIPENLELSELMKFPSIQLFVDRAVKVNMDFQLNDENARSVVEICRRMDGLPLALELAAARIRILPPDKLLDRLTRALDILTSGSKDLPERHQTLRATIDWSYSLLNEVESRLFRRLSVFVGGFTLEAAESVCYTKDEDGLFAMDELESLINKGLIENIGGGQRFNMLQTINDFAREQLVKEKEMELFMDKHADYYLEFSEKVETGVMLHEQLEWMKKGSLEESNFLAGLDHLLANARKGSEISREKGFLICGALWLYWHIRGKHESAKNYINSFFDATNDKSASIGKCKALLTLSVASFTLAEYEACKDQGLMHYKFAQELQNDLELAKAAFSTGFGYFPFDLETAKKYNIETVTRFEKLKKDYWIGLSLWQGGIFYLSAGDNKMAKDQFAESINYFERINDYEGKGGSLSGLAMLEVMGGNLDEALKIYQKSLSSFESVGDRPEEARILSEMSWVYLAQKNTSIARKYALDSIQAYQEVGSMRGVGISMFGLASIEVIEGRPQRALEIAAAAEQFAKQAGIVVEYGLNNQGKVYLDNARNMLTDIEIKNAQDEGKGLSLREVLQMESLDAIMIE